MRKLYSYWRSSASYRVRIVLEWKSIPYEYHAVDISPDRSAQYDPAYEAINPMRQVPVLEWEEWGQRARLVQSVAICEFLEEVQPDPPLLPREALDRARVRAAVEIVNSGIQPLQNLRLLAELGRISEEAKNEWARDAIGRGLLALEALAADHGGDFLYGDDVSLADVFLVPQLYNARRFGVDLVHFPRLLEIEHRTEELEAFRRAKPERQPDAPDASSMT